MYYGHMSKKDIMNSSRPFLYGIYKSYAKRACENLGVSSEIEKDEVKDTQLKDTDYPREFHKISDIDRKNTMSALADDKEFMKQFSEVFKQF